jgi:hypothetical protein
MPSRVWLKFIANPVGLSYSRSQLEELRLYRGSTMLSLVTSLSVSRRREFPSSIVDTVRHIDLERQLK